MLTGTNSFHFDCYLIFLFFSLLFLLFSVRVAVCTLSLIRRLVCYWRSAFRWTMRRPIIAADFLFKVIKNKDNYWFWNLKMHFHSYDARLWNHFITLFIWKHSLNHHVRGSRWVSFCKTWPFTWFKSIVTWPYLHFVMTWIGVRAIEHWRFD